MDVADLLVEMALGLTEHVDGPGFERSFSLFVGKALSRVALPSLQEGRDVARRLNLVLPRPHRTLSLGQLTEQEHEIVWLAECGRCIPRSTGRVGEHEQE